MHSTVQKFWEVENIPSTKHLSEQERECERHIIQNTSRDVSEHYTVKLPFNQLKPELDNSFQTAELKLYALERRFNNDQELYKKYKKFLNEYVELDHMEEIDDIESLTQKYFIPHHAVFKQSSHTTNYKLFLMRHARLPLECY